MTTREAPAFGDLLSHYRIAAGLTQEELAERANLSVRGISDLERGVRTRPQPMTVRQLAEALQLSPQDRSVFEEAAHASGAARRRDDTLPGGSFLGALPSAPLVGRADDAERMNAILDAVVEGSGHVLLLSGELGVGKTRLLQELMVAARSRNFLVVTGRCDAAEQQRLYAPLLAALGGLTVSMPAGARSEGQRLWKRVQQLTHAASDGIDTVVQQHLFGTVTDLVMLVSRSVPLAVLLDDLQWADGGSLELLHHLARTTRSSSILLAGAFRDLRLSTEHPDLAHALQVLSRERLAERITVRRLSLEETTALVAIAMGQEEVSEEFTHFVYRRTKGIPRLIEQLIRSLGGRLELHGEIGAGAMGRVFRAFDRTTEQTVAAKLVLARQEIDLDALLRFQQEGAVLAQLDHPHIVCIYDTFVEEHASCIIMELLEGQSLGTALQDGPLALSRAQQLALQVTDALGYAHSQGIVHRDIKPDNVMVLPDDRVKVTDFGIARILQPDTSLQTIATTGMRMGTPLYMAPEQIEGKKVDGRTDIYALGAMFYHMVTGRPPFEGADALTVAVKHLQEEPLPPSRVNPSLPQEWDGPILKAMAKDPAQRFQSASEMARALNALPVSAPVNPPMRAGRWKRRVGIVGGLAAGITAAAILLTAVVVHPRSSGAQEPALARKLDAYLTVLTKQNRMSGTVLVARGGQIIFDKGYGLADRQDHVPNGRAVIYPSVASFNVNLTAALRLEEEGKLHATDPICRYLSGCASIWQPITVGRVIDGTSALPSIDWGTLPGTTEQSVTACQDKGLYATPSPGAADYENCDVIVLGTIFQKITGQSWDAVIRRTVLDPAGMKTSGRLTDALKPPARADDYNGAVSGSRNAYNTYFELYSTTPDVLRFDNALFGGRLLSPADLKTLLTPRDSEADPGIADARMAYMWKIAHVAGQPVFYRYGTTDLNFTAINMRFPRDGTTIIVNSNVRQDDAELLGINLAKLIYGRRLVLPAPPPRILTIVPSRAVQATIDIQSTVHAPDFSDGTLWLPDDSFNTVTRVSARTDAVAGVSPLFPKLINNPGGGVTATIAGSGSQLWVASGDRAHGSDNELLRLDPTTGTVVQRRHVPVSVYQLSVDHGVLWGTSFAKNTLLLRIDPRTGSVTRIGRSYGGSNDVLAGGGFVWVTSYQQNSQPGMLRKIDARTGRVLATLRVGFDPESLALGFGSLWVVNGTGGYVTRIDPRTNRVLARITTGTDEWNTFFTLHSVATGYGAVWVVDHKDGTLVRIDPRTDRVTSRLVLPLPSNMQTLAAFDVALGSGSVWVHAEPHLVFRIDPNVMKKG